MICSTSSSKASLHALSRIQLLRLSFLTQPCCQGLASSCLSCLLQQCTVCIACLPATEPSPVSTPSSPTYHIHIEIMRGILERREEGDREMEMCPPGLQSTSHTHTGACCLNNKGQKVLKYACSMAFGSPPSCLPTSHPSLDPPTPLLIFTQTIHISH